MSHERIWKAVYFSSWLAIDWLNTLTTVQYCKQICGFKKWYLRIWTPLLQHWTSSKYNMYTYLILKKKPSDQPNYVFFLFAFYIDFNSVNCSALINLSNRLWYSSCDFRIVFGQRLYWWVHESNNFTCVKQAQVSFKNAGGSPQH